MNNSDTRTFRNVLGQFPTGVTVVTALNNRGEKLGITVSSFNSVSLTPPLILWSIDKNNFSFTDYTTASHFAVHVLASDQIEVSNCFAAKGTDKFANCDIRDGIAGIPLLHDYAACFQCETSATHDAGDHVIIVGKVLAFDSNERDPLVFHRGTYAVIA